MSNQSASGNQNGHTERVTATPTEQITLHHGLNARRLLPLTRLRGTPADSSITDGPMSTTSRVRPLRFLQALCAPVVETVTDYAPGATSRTPRVPSSPTNDVFPRHASHSGTPESDQAVSSAWRAPFRPEDVVAAATGVRSSPQTTKRKAKQLTPLTRAVVPKLESLSRPAPTFRRVLGAAGRSDASTSRALKSESGEWAAAHRHASPISSRARLFHSNALTDRAQSCSHAESTTQGFQIPISGRIPRPPSPTVEWEGEGHGGTLERWSPRKLKSGTFIGFAARATSHLSSTRTAHVLWQHSISHKLIGVEVAHSAEDVVRPSLCLRVLSVLPDDDRRQWPTSSACSATTPRRIGGRKSVLLHCHLSSRPTGAQSKQMLNPKSDAQSGLVLLSVLDSPASVARVGEIVPQSLDLAGQKTSTAATSNTFVPTSTADLLHIQAGSVVWVFHPYHCVEIVAAQSDAKRAHLICSRFLIAI